MKFKVKNVGPLQEASVEVGNVTVICGKNNTGKTYLTYAFYGFLNFLKEKSNRYLNPRYSTDEENNYHRKLIKLIKIQNLENTGINIPIDVLKNIFQSFLKQTSLEYRYHLDDVFGSDPDFFKKSEFTFEENINFNDYEKKQLIYKRRLSRFGTDLTFSIKDNKELNIKLTKDLIESHEKDTQVRILGFHLKEVVVSGIMDFLFNLIFNDVFMMSCERTGAAIFQKELNFARNRLLEDLPTIKKESDVVASLRQNYRNYAIPVRKNVDFIRELPDIKTTNKSFLHKEDKDLLKNFINIVEGKYKIINKTEIKYIPKINSKINLFMDESSSMVRSLMDLNFYLNHIVEKGDILMIDEPELNLHPENQRRLARILARLSNHGVKVFITTHSDYIIKEFNLLLALNHRLKQEKVSLETLKKKLSFQKMFKEYDQKELLKKDDIRVYMMQKKGEKIKVQEAPKNEHHQIELSSFDQSIEEMNALEDTILYSDFPTS